MIRFPLLSYVYWEHSGWDICIATGKEKWRYTRYSAKGSKQGEGRPKGNGDSKRKIVMRHLIGTTIYGYAAISINGYVIIIYGYVGNVQAFVGVRSIDRYDQSIGIVRHQYISGVDR